MKSLKFKNLSPTPLLIVLAVFVFITVPLRVFQLCNCVDPETGFWAARDFTVLSVYIICALFCLVSFFMTFFSGIISKPTFHEEKNIPLGVCTAIFVVGLLVQSILNVSKVITIFSSFVASETQSLANYLISSGGLMMVFEIIFGILAAVYFCFVTISSFTGRNSFQANKLLALTPALWAMFRMIYHFIDPVNFKNVSQLFLQLIMLAFASVFFLSFARIASDIHADKSMWIFWFTGTCAALFAYVAALAPFILVITGKGNLIPAAYPLQFSDLGLALFITSFLFTVTPLTADVEE